MALTNAQHQKLWRDRRRAEKNMRAEPEAEAYIETLHGVAQDVAIRRLVAIGPARFVAEIAHRQRTERLRELRARETEQAARERELSPIRARVKAMRKARGYVDAD